MGPFLVCDYYAQKAILEVTTGHSSLFCAQYADLECDYWALPFKYPL